MMNNPTKDVIATNSLKKEEISQNKPKIRRSNLAKNLLIRGENTRKFEELRLRLLEELYPITEIQKILCEKFISTVWKHGRAVEVEKNILSSQNVPTYTEGEEVTLESEFALPDRRMRNIKKIRLDKPSVEKIIRYESDLQKTMLKILERYREEQKISKSIDNTK